MDLSRIFIKDCNPTKMGGQAVMDGVMMKGANKQAVAVRLPDGEIYVRTQKLPERGGWSRIPVLRGLLVFLESLINGTKTLMYSADVLEKYEEKAGEAAAEEKGRTELWLEKRFGERALWNILVTVSVVTALALAVGIFVIGPTAVISGLGRFIHSGIILNLIEGLLRIAIFIIYVLLIRRMEDIKNVFRYHGAEHKCIHCYESGRQLIPENCEEFYTLHPRCGTSFIVFVLVISLILFSFLGWPNLAARIISRLLLIPVIAGLSYEVLKLAGRSTNRFIMLISVPGLWLQKLTTAEPDRKQLEVAIASINAVLDTGAPCFEGISGMDGKLKMTAEEYYREKENAEDSGTAADGADPAQGSGDS